MLHSNSQLSLHFLVYPDAPTAPTFHASPALLIISPQHKESSGAFRQRHGKRRSSVVCWWIRNVLCAIIICRKKWGYWRLLTGRFCQRRDSFFLQNKIGARRSIFGVSIARQRVYQPTSELDELSTLIPCRLLFSEGAAEKKTLDDRHLHQNWWNPMEMDSHHFVNELKQQKSTFFAPSNIRAPQERRNK